MKRLFLLTLLLLSAFTRPAYGEGLNLAWTDCAGSSTAAADQTFSCDDDSRVFALIGSFIPPGGISHLTGLEGLLEVTASQRGIPNWWHLETGGCRDGSFGAEFNFFGMPACANYWDNQAFGGALFSPSAAPGSSSGPNIALLCAMAQQQAGPVSAGREYYAFKLLLDAAKTSSGICGGCSEGVCVTLASLKLTQPVGEGDNLITTPALRNCVTWQGGVAGCPAACRQPTRRNSWGQLKNMYR